MNIFTDGDCNQKFTLTNKQTHIQVRGKLFYFDYRTTQHHPLNTLQVCFGILYSIDEHLQLFNPHQRHYFAPHTDEDVTPPTPSPVMLPSKPVAHLTGEATVKVL